MNDDSHSGVAAAAIEPAGEQVKPELLVLTEKQAVRFWSKVQKSPEPDGCWIWTGARFHDDYGNFNLEGRRGKRSETRAHRVSWLIHRGPIPDGLCVCHNCPGGDRPDCVNPGHLWLGTHLQNMLDREAKERGNQVSGDAHHSKHNPGHMACGDRNGSRTHPEVRPRGEGHWNAKVNATQVVEIRALCVQGKMTRVAIGKLYGISDAMVYAIHSRKSWAHIP